MALGRRLDHADVAPSRLGYGPNADSGKAAIKHRPLAAFSAHDERAGQGVAIAAAQIGRRIDAAHDGDPISQRHAAVGLGPFPAPARQRSEKLREGIGAHQRGHSFATRSEYLRVRSQMRSPGWSVWKSVSVQ